MATVRAPSCKKICFNEFCLTHVSDGKVDTKAMMMIMMTVVIFNETAEVEFVVRQAD